MKIENLSVYLRMIVVVSLLYASTSLGEEIQDIIPTQPSANTFNIGVLAFRSKEKTRQRWHELTTHLSHLMPGYRMKIVPLNYPELEAAVTAKRLDFVLTNTGHYVKLETLYNITRLATLVRRINTVNLFYPSNLWN